MASKESKEKPKLIQLFFSFFFFPVADALCHARQTQTWKEEEEDEEEETGGGYIEDSTYF